MLMDPWDVYLFGSFQKQKTSKSTQMHYDPHCSDYQNGAPTLEVRKENDCPHTPKLREEGKPA